MGVYSMNKRALRLVAVVAAILPIGHTLAIEPDAFDVALDNGDYVGAAKEIEKISQEPRAKEELDAYYGRIFAASGQGQVAEPYLVRAIAAAKTGRDKDQLGFELARAREVDGFVAKAEADYRKLVRRRPGGAARRNPFVGQTVAGLRSRKSGSDAHRAAR
jgi:tetratricopeptide (TPR) repeat protein